MIRTTATLPLLGELKSFHDQTVNKLTHSLYVEMRIIWCGTAPIKFEETVIFAVGISRRNPSTRRSLCP